jgi:hypothetical protein
MYIHTQTHIHTHMHTYIRTSLHNVLGDIASGVCFEDCTRLDARFSNALSFKPSEEKELSAFESGKRLETSLADC